MTKCGHSSHFAAWMKPCQTALKSGGLVYREVEMFILMDAIMNAYRVRLWLR